MVRNCLRKSKHRRKGDPEVAALIRRLLADSSLTYHRKLARLISWEKKNRGLVACPCPTDERLAKGMLTLLLEDALGHFEDTTNRPL